MTNKNFKTDCLNLEELCQYGFSIPTYQRPYVWKTEQVKQLLDDFKKAFENKEANYYIGTILTENKEQKYNLIDGQQRFTTLWLLAFAISKVCEGSDISKFIRYESKNTTQLRLDFEIRTEVKLYLNALISGETVYSEEQVSEKPYLVNIASNLSFIEGFVKNLKEDQGVYLECFGNYVYRHVKLVNNTTPVNTDINKLFSVVNNSGIQLSQTDILKSLLLKKISSQKVLYSKLWESCEYMDSFFERNVAKSFTNSSEFDFSMLVEFEGSRLLYEKEDDSDGESEDVTEDKKKLLSQILVLQKSDSDEQSEPQTQNQEEKDLDEVYCRSIISFPQLLLHTYRIYLKEQGFKQDYIKDFHPEKLIQIFKPLIDGNLENKELPVDKFFYTLWKVRFLFDKYIVKWIPDSQNADQQYLSLARLSKSSSSYIREVPETKSEMLMLQSILYHTSDANRRYWLTSYLDYLYYNHNNSACDTEKNLAYLEKIDNVLSAISSRSNKDISWELMMDAGKFNLEIKIDTELDRNLGTGFKHYWFYKLEYLLWKRWEKRDDKQFINYRIVSRNSVEHVFPQNGQNGIKLEDKYLNCFGNLGLITVSQNSSYSDQDIGKKKIDFDKRDTYDSLKLAEIYSHRDFDTNSLEKYMKVIEDNSKMCKNVLNEHYANS